MCCSSFCRSHGIEDTQASPYGSLGIIFVCHGIAKIHQQSIAQQLGNIPVIAFDHCGTRLLIRPDNFSILFGVKLGESVVESTTSQNITVSCLHSASAVGGATEGLALSRRDVRRSRQRNWRGGCPCAGRPTCPDEHSAVLIHCQLFGVDHVLFEVFQDLVVELEPALECPVGDALLPLKASTCARTAS